MNIGKRLLIHLVKWQTTATNLGSPAFVFRFPRNGCVLFFQQIGKEDSRLFFELSIISPID